MLCLNDALLRLHRAMKKDARTVASWDIEKIIPCHGVSTLRWMIPISANWKQDVIESKGDEAWRAAYRGFLN